MNDELKVSYLNSVLASGIELIGLVERPWSTERRGISPLFLLGKSERDEGSNLWLKRF